jgi:hypothetical protein
LPLLLIPNPPLEGVIEAVLVIEVEPLATRTPLPLNAPLAPLTLPWLTNVPEDIETPDASDPLALIFSWPLVSCDPPVKVFIPPSSRLVPETESPPNPEIAPLNVELPFVIVKVFAPRSMLPEPEIVPMDVPEVVDPILNAPFTSRELKLPRLLVPDKATVDEGEMVTEPLYVFAPLKVIVPEPRKDRGPEPDRIPEMVYKLPDPVMLPPLADTVILFETDDKSRLRFWNVVATGLELAVAMSPAAFHAYISMLGAPTTLLAL